MPWGIVLLGTTVTRVPSALPGAGHVPMLTHATSYNQIVADFLNDIDPASREDVSG